MISTICVSFNFSIRYPVRHFVGAKRMDFKRRRIRDIHKVGNIALKKQLMSIIQSRTA